MNTFKNRLDRHWKEEEFLYNFEAAMLGLPPPVRRQGQDSESSHCHGIGSAYHFYNNYDANNCVLLTATLIVTVSVIKLIHRQNYSHFGDQL